MKTDLQQIIQKKAMFGARLFSSVHSGPAAPQPHFIYDNDAETSLSELLADPVTLALAASDGLSAYELETFIADITGKLKDKPQFIPVR